MQMVFRYSYYFIVVLLLTSVNGDGDAKTVTPTTSTSVASPIPVELGKETSLVEESDSLRVKVYSRLKEYVENNKYFKRYFGPLNKLDIPSDLTGKSDKEIMNYVYLLRKQRRTLKRRMGLTMVVTTVSLVGGYVFSKLLLPVVALIESQNTVFAMSLDTDWMVFQHQLSAFLWEYMRVKNIDVASLRSSIFIDCRRIKLEFAPGLFTTFPVWTSNKEDQIPVTANVRSNLSMLKHWYFSRR